MVERFKIAAYTRISVDTEKDDDNTSIENQKKLIAEYCMQHFPTSTVDYFEDRDKSGYTFEQRPDYMKLRPKLFAGDYDILIVKDLSRFSRRNGRGLAEIEDLRDSGLRIIAITDGVDIPTKDDWVKVQVYFFVNEMPVTDASRKVSAVIKNRQKRGEWICSVPYGYVMTNTKKMLFEVDEAAAEVVREIFRLYIDGWGYKKIANHLTNKKIPTPRMCEKLRKEASGDDYRGKVREQWSIVTVSEILCNDFYIGTLRSHKFQRKKINGDDIPVHESQHIVFENNHPAIVDYRMFSTAQEQLKLRTRTHYRGVKKYDNTYSGFLRCGDCGKPMFAMSRKDLAEAYTCGTYHVRGLAGCTSHHIRADFLDEVLKEYIREVRDKSSSMITILKEILKSEENTTEGGKQAAEQLQAEIEREREVLRTLLRQKARDVMRASNRDIVEETYDIEIAATEDRITGLQNQLAMVADTTNSIIRVNRTAKTVIDIFNDILSKPKLDKNDLHLIISYINVFEDHIEVKLKADVDELLRTGTIEHLQHDEEPFTVNFDRDTENIEKADDSYEIVVAQRAKNQRDKVFRVNVISGGDPLEIYTDREGEVIFKKYSPIGELAEFASQYAETLHKTCNMSVIICDRDAVIACSGLPKREYADKRLSSDLEKIIASRSLYVWQEGSDKLSATVDGGSHHIGCAMPILTEGDIIGCVASLVDNNRTPELNAELEAKLVQTASSFLGRQLES